MSFEYVLYKGRDETFAVSIFEDDGSTLVVLASTDVVRFKIGRGANAPDLDLDSAAASANGSTVSLANPAVITIKKADTTGLAVGSRDAEVSVVDDSDSDHIKIAETGVVHLMETMAGDTGLA